MTCTYVHTHIHHILYLYEKSKKFLVVESLTTHWWLMCAGEFFLQIPHGRSSEKDFIVKSITNMCDVPFVPDQASASVTLLVFV